MKAAARTFALCAILASSGCADAPPAPPGDDGPSDRYETDATVLDDGSGPELCLGGVAESLPPQCGGMPIVGWSWDDVEGEDRASGVTWGEYHLVGTYDGISFTVEDVGPPHPSSDDGSVDQFRAPCPEPAGGWTDVDPSRTAESDRIAAMRVAEDLPGYAGIWIDQLAEPVDEIQGPVVLVVGIAGDADSFEDELRAVWGGPLCMVGFAHTHRELRQTQSALSDGGAAALGLELLWSSVNVMENRVEIGTVVANASDREALDAAYGEGVVLAVPALRPV
jgi:hypothetical protein